METIYNVIGYNYDARFDVLYLAFADKSTSYGNEDDDGIIIMRDMYSGVITGITIFNFAARCRSLDHVI